MPTQWLAHKRILLDEVLRYPLVLGDPAVCEGYTRQVDRVLRTQEQEPLLVQRVASPEVMVALVTSSYQAFSRCSASGW